MIRNHDALDFGSAFVDRKDPCIPEKAFHRIILDKSVSAMHLKRFGRDPVDHFGGKEFGHGGLGR